MKYDAQKTPAQWLELDDGERIELVRRYHRSRSIEVPNQKLHAIFHVVVENQLALGVAAVARALARLQEGGLDRHDAIHAIGSVLAEHVHGGLLTSSNMNEAYLASLEELTAVEWRRLGEESDED